YVGVPGPSPAITDTRFDASIFGEYRVRDWLGFNATVQYVGETSSNRIPTGFPASGFDLQFNRFQAMAGVRAFF
ncbi:MAG: hypothetical protein ABI175_09265, partial [Polyangiales bacterium]